MTAPLSVEQLIAEGKAAPVEGWDFSWLEGRATEERPSCGYLRSMSERMARAHGALDVQTGGGEVLAQAPHPPQLLAATESWPPNLQVARRNLRPLEAFVVQAADHGALPCQALTPSPSARTAALPVPPRRRRRSASSWTTYEPCRV